jgi:hypothetical protein
MFPVSTEMEFNESTTTSQITDLGVTFSFDHTIGEFAIQDGKITMISGLDGLKQWVNNLLHTEKYSFSCFTSTTEEENGVTLKDLKGYTQDLNFVKSELQREIEEGLTKHPAIIGTSSFSVSQQDDDLDITFTLLLNDAYIPSDIDTSSLVFSFTL